MLFNFKVFLGKYTSFFVILFFLATGQKSIAQIYYHNFGTTTISSYPYNVAPVTFNSHLSNSSWTNSIGSWTSNTGATGEAIRLTTATSATITLTFDVGPNFQAEITSFDFWRQRSNFGPQNWSMAINGINVGSGTIGTTGAAIGTTNVSNAISGLSGTVTVVISLTGATGNGTFRLDDFTLNGSVTSSCIAPVIASFTPASGPQNTLVTINGSGFQNGTGTSSVKFNGIEAASFIVISNTQIKAYVPSGNVSGNISVTTNGCDGVSTGSFVKITSQAVISYTTDIYISEVYDANGGDRGVIELYNGTASTVNLAGYSIGRYGDIGNPSPDYSYVLSGFIPPQTTFLVHVGNNGTNPTPCGLNDNGQILGAGFNANDEFKLFKNSVVIDDVQAPNSVGYSMTRNLNAVAPKLIFNNSDWGTQFNTANCEVSSTCHCSDLGIHNVPTPVIPVVTSPSSKVACENGSTSFSATISNSTGYTYQWKVVGASGIWSNVVNGGSYSGANTSTLTINPALLAFDDNQYYCQITSATVATVISNAAQLRVNALNIIPTFNLPTTICSTATPPALPTTSLNGITGTWSPSAITTSGTYTFTPTTGQCATTYPLVVTITNSVAPTFNLPTTICSTATPPALPTTSLNGITGTWSPSAITTSGTYTFTPNTGQCATTYPLVVTVTNSVPPTFNLQTTICSTATPPTLPTTSINGITGTWSPSAITTSGTYTFTPNTGQCATTYPLVVTVTNSVSPTFNLPTTICSTATPPALPTTSLNGITGTWSPSAITTSGTYTFTPTAGQCATTYPLVVTITNSVAPTFNLPTTICSTATPPTLPTTSLNGINGTWSPSAITTSGTYTFTPTTGQCATTYPLMVTITNSVAPTFNIPTTICSTSTPPALPTTSLNGVTGTWSPSAITTSGTYTFTPTTGQCATTYPLVVTVTNSVSPTFNLPTTICSTATPPTLPTTSLNGINGTWSPSAITTSGTYTFTPTTGQCATTYPLVVTVTNSVSPTFNLPTTICSTATPPTLPTTSLNGITGTWSPSAITTSGTYTFTPTAGQCANNYPLAVTITNSVAPTFNLPTTICSTATPPTLPTTSLNGITGTWSPSAITTSGTYTFTPPSGQCATTFPLVVTITNSVSPTFNLPTTICGTPPALPTTSLNGINGTWSPSAITTSGTYIFTPTTGQCATTYPLVVTLTNSIAPTFNIPTTICGTPPSLPTTSLNGITGTWSPSAITTSGTYTFTPTAGQCANNYPLAVTITNSVAPTFNLPTTICSTATPPALPNTSVNGIMGTWSPSAITTSGTYTFTPTAGQCATTYPLVVTVTNSITPTFNLPMTICGTPPALPTTSLNGITGTWSSSAITASGTYIFTPNIGQCATTYTLVVTVTNSITPTFNIPTTICGTATPPTLPTTSLNGITGTWSPSAITTSGTYTFTPTAGQCALPSNIIITVNQKAIPTFAQVNAICSGDTLAALPTTSAEGITGTWSPALNTTSTTVYTFTPDAGQCALPSNMTITVNSKITPTFLQVSAICSGTPLPALPSSSTEGITGSWSPVLDNTATTTYTFVPDAGQCAIDASMTIVVNELPEVKLEDKYLCVDKNGTILSTVDLNCGVFNTDYSYVWTYNNMPLPTITNIHTARAPGDYKVTVTNRLTGCSNIAVAKVGISSLAIADAVVGNDFNANQTITVNVTGGSGDYEFQLDDGYPQASNQFNNVYDGEYTIIVRDKKGCGELVLSVYALNYPRFFTPNGDGINDLWNINGLYNQPKAKIYIFDRFGKLITAVQPASGSGWDGTYNGKELPSTDYWFTLSYMNKAGIEKELKAHFSLKR